MRPVATLGLSLSSVALFGCAGMTVTSIPDATTDAAATGFRYYESAPFLLIYADGKGGLTSQVHFLPDTTKKRSIRPYNYLASNNTTLTFADGKLTGAKAEIDETAIPTAIVSGLETIAKSAIKAANANEQIPGPYLFRIIKTDGRWALAGGQAVDATGTIITIRYVTP